MVWAALLLGLLALALIIQFWYIILPTFALMIIWAAIASHLDRKKHPIRYAFRDLTKKYHGDERAKGLEKRDPAYSCMIKLLRDVEINQPELCEGASFQLLRSNLVARAAEEAAENARRERVKAEYAGKEKLVNQMQNGLETCVSAKWETQFEVFENSK